MIGIAAPGIGALRIGHRTPAARAHAPEIGLLDRYAA